MGKSSMLPGDRNPGWGDVGRDASSSGGKGAAGRAEGQGVEPAGDRGPARPGGLDLDALGDAELQEIVLTHNLTPRKCLGFLTPLQALLGELGRDVRIRFA